jgi:hypothetical protein
MVRRGSPLSWEWPKNMASVWQYHSKSGWIKSIEKYINKSLNIRKYVFSRSANQDEFDKIIDQLSAKPKARAVVLFVDEDGTRYTMNLNHIS